MDKKAASILGFVVAIILTLLIYLFYSVIILYFMLIVLVVSSILLALLVFKDYYGGTKLESLTLREFTTLFDELYDIRHILIIHKPSGLCIFDQSYSKQRFDPLLISGFLQAITQFGIEFASDQELEELNYQKFKILLGIGNFVRIALILNRSPSEFMKKTVKRFILTFEKKYLNLLTTFLGDISVFSESFYLIEEIFHISYTFPHRVSSQIEEKPLNSIEKVLVEIGQALSEEKGFFELKDLLTFATITNLGERNFIISSLIKLIEDELFYPLIFMAPDTVWKQRVTKGEEFIAKAEDALSSTQFASAAKYYEQASEIFNELGDIEKYLTYLRKAEEIRSTELSIREKMEYTRVKEEKLSKKQELENLITTAHEFFKQNELSEAYRVYLSAIPLAIEFEDIDNLKLIAQKLNTIRETDEELQQEFTQQETEFQKDHDNLLQEVQVNLTRNPKEVAELMYQAAQISIILGDFNRALDELSKGKEYKIKELEEETIKMMPKLAVSIEKVGKLTNEEQEIINLCDGMHSTEDICNKLSMSELKVQEIVRKFEKKGRIKLVKRLVAKR